VYDDNEKFDTNIWKAMALVFFWPLVFLNGWYREYRAKKKRT
jgi:hypothetical protein